MDWEEEYKRKLISAEEAAGLIKSNDRIIITLYVDPPAITKAIAARRDELENVTVTIGGVGRYDCDWFNPEPEWVKAFPMEVMHAGFLTRRRLHANKADYMPSTLSLYYKPEVDLRPDRARWDYFLFELAPPDANGYCNLGYSLFNTKRIMSVADKIIAEVNPNMIRTYGDTSVHVSEIDYFVEHSSPRPTPTRILTIDEVSTTIGEYVSTLIRDRDTIQIGTGTITNALAAMGVFDGKHDLGLHTELTATGVLHLVESGVITGKYKTINPNKIVCTMIWPEPGMLEFANENPLFEVREASYVNDPAIIAAHDNMVAINSALAVDLTGQIATESIGRLVWAGPGGQLDFATGALHSKGGRSIVTIPSTATVKGELKSRIVPEVAVATIPRTLADYVVTEFGIASVFNKTLRKRAEEFIAIAHPDFRAELRRQAQEFGYL